jgi:hypothetical protein
MFTDATLRRDEEVFNEVENIYKKSFPLHLGLRFGGVG